MFSEQEHWEWRKNRLPEDQTWFDIDDLAEVFSDGWMAAEDETLIMVSGAREEIEHALVKYKELETMKARVESLQSIVSEQQKNNLRLSRELAKIRDEANKDKNARERATQQLSEANRRLSKLMGKQDEPGWYPTNVSTFPKRGMNR